MNTSIWGPSGWRLIHSTAFTYPRNPTFVDKQRYKMFFESLAYTLPCVNCQHNFQKELLQFDLDRALRSREDLARWSIDLHNSVNKRLGKKIMSYKEVQLIYKDLIDSVDKERKENKNKEDKELTSNKKLLCVVGLFGLGCLIYRYRKNK